MRTSLVLATLVLGGSGAAAAQEIENRVDAAPPDAFVRLTFDARPGLCGDGENILFLREDGEHGVSILRNRGSGMSGRTRIRELRERCDEGPVRVTLERSAGRVTDVEVEVGGSPDAIVEVLDLGHVAPDAAVAYLLDSLAPRADGRTARDAIFAATLAGGAEPWPALLRLARDRDLAREVRRHAVFWLGQAAAERAVDGLIDIASADDEDIALRKHALFALAQRKDERSIDALLDIAREHEHAELRKAAIFWLGQSDDARALQLFEEILLGR
jgi:hypothetical protein